MKSLIVIILVVKELNFCCTGIVVSGDGGGGGLEVVSGNTKFCTFSCSPKAAVPCSNRISWNVISEFNLFFEFADMFLSCQLGRPY